MVLFSFIINHVEVFGSAIVACYIGALGLRARDYEAFLRLRQVLIPISGITVLLSILNFGTMFPIVNGSMITDAQITLDVTADILLRDENPSNDLPDGNDDVYSRRDLEYLIANARRLQRAFFLIVELVVFYGMIALVWAGTTFVFPLSDKRPEKSDIQD